MATKKLSGVPSLSALSGKETIVIISNKVDGGIAQYDVDSFLDLIKNSIKIGGRNLALETSTLGTFSVIKGVPGCMCTNASFFVNLTLGNRYMISFDARLVSGNGFLHVEFNGSRGDNVTVSSAEWERYGVISEYYQHKTLYFWLVSGEGEIQVRNIKIENGNMPTDWTPAPED